MIIQCDKCDAKFNLADDKVSDKGVKVRCSKCKHVFIANKPEDSEADSLSSDVDSLSDTDAAASSAAPESPPSEPATNDDPFTNFSFSDESDFESPDQPSEPEPDFSSEREPSVPPQQDTEPNADEDFSFDDEDFSDSTSEPPAPESVDESVDEEKSGDFDFTDDDFSSDAAEPKESKEVAAPAPPDSDNVQFGDFDFDDEEEDEDTPAVSDAGSPEEKEDWGNVSLSDDMPDMSGEQKPADDSFSFGEDEAGGSGDGDSFGDFQFDAGEGDEQDSPVSDEFDMGDDLGFVRSETSAAPVQDDLEASLGDSDSDIDVPSRGGDSDTPEIPDKPLIKHSAESQSSFSWTPIIVLLVFLGAIVGFVAWTVSTGEMTVDDYTHLRLSKLGDVGPIKSLLIKQGWKEEPDEGVVEVIKNSVETRKVVRADGEIWVITGDIRVTFRKSKSFVKVESRLLDSDNQTLARQHSYCDVYFTEEELVSLDRDEIKLIMEGSSGRYLKCRELSGGVVLPFTIVFLEMPAGVKKFTPPKVVDYIDADAAD